jgi:hypothetical protein
MVCRVDAGLADIGVLLEVPIPIERRRSGDVTGDKTTDDVLKSSAKRAENTSHHGCDLHADVSPAGAFLQARPTFRAAGGGSERFTALCSILAAVAALPVARFSSLIALSEASEPGLDFAEPVIFLPVYRIHLQCKI